MNLMCGESSEGCEVMEQGMTLSTLDHNLMVDPRVLNTLLETEDSYSIKCDYIRKVQNEITADNRKILAGWMSEVCEEQRCGEIVLPLAMNYMDRFLSQVRITKDKLQLLGCVCLILASKLRQYRTFTVDQMVYYSDYSCSAKQLIEWELMVLNQLGWDVSSVTANDFVDHILYRLPLSQEHTAIVKKHALVFITLCSTEYAFSQWRPSTLACASIAAAADGLSWLPKSWKSLDHLLDMIHDITNIETTYLRSCVDKIEELVKIGLSILETSNEDTMKQSSKFSSQQSSLSTTPTTSKLMDSSYQPETPTDVTDINF